MSISAFSQMPLLLEFYALATSKVISGRVSTSHSAHSLSLYSAVLLGDQAANTMTRYPTQSHYLDTEPNSSSIS